MMMRCFLLHVLVFISPLGWGQTVNPVEEGMGSKNQVNQAGGSDKHSNAKQKVAPTGALQQTIDAKGIPTQQRDSTDDSIAFNRESLRLNSSYVLATWILAGVGLLTLVGYAIQSYFLIRTFRNARKTSRRGLRAYVGPLVHETHFVFPDHFILKIKNCGQTPAYGVLCDLNWICFSGDRVAWPDSHPFQPWNGPIGSVFTLLPGETNTSEIRFNEVPPPSGFSLSEAVTAFDKQEVTIYFFGVIKYRDTFGKDRFSNYCYRLVPGGTRRLAVHHRYNDSN